MAKYVVILNKIVEADSEEAAIRKVKLTADYAKAECFKYGNEPHPFDGDVAYNDLVGATCKDRVDIGAKP